MHRLSVREGEAVSEAIDAAAKLKFVTAVLALADSDGGTTKLWDNIFVIVRDGEVTFMVNCNDLFWWATADGEYITPDNLPILLKAVQDVRAALGVPSEPGGADRERWERWYDAPSFAGELFAARVREMRPQRPCYKSYPPELVPLFDACGPERDPKEEG